MSPMPLPPALGFSAGTGSVWGGRGRDGKWMGEQTDCPLCTISLQVASEEKLSSKLMQTSRGVSVLWGRKLGPSNTCATLRYLLLSRFLFTELRIPRFKAEKDREIKK